MIVLKNYKFTRITTFEKQKGCFVISKVIQKALNVPLAKVETFRAFSYLFLFQISI